MNLQPVWIPFQGRLCGLLLIKYVQIESKGAAFREEFMKDILEKYL